MGIWQTYCPLCGFGFNPFDFEYDILHLSKYYKEKEKNKLSKFLNKLLGEDKSKWNKKIKELNSKFKWMSKYGLLLPNEFKKTGIDYEEQGIANNYPICSIITYLPEKERAFMIHIDCYNLIPASNKKTFYKQIYPMVYTKKNEIHKHPSGYIKGINYGCMKKFAIQDYMWFDAILDNCFYFRDDNKIKKNINIIIKSKKKLRPSPTESATVFKEGTVRKGNDNKLYIVRNNKWKIVN